MFFFWIMLTTPQGHQRHEPKHRLNVYTQQLFHTFIEGFFFFHIDLKMFTETVPSRCIAMESKAMSIECKTQYHKNDANINAIHVRIVFLIQTTDYKNINEIFSYALKQRWKYRMSMSTFQHACTARVNNTCTFTQHTHTSLTPPSGDETTRNKKVISSVLQCVFFLQFLICVWTAESGVCNISCLADRQLNAESILRSNDSGTVTPVSHCNRCLCKFSSSDCKTPEWDLLLV